MLVVAPELAWRALLLFLTAVGVSARMFPRPGYFNPWEIEYNLYYGHDKDIDISKMFLLPPIEDGIDETEKVENYSMPVRRNGRIEMDNPGIVELEHTYDEIKEKFMFENFDDNMKMEKEMFEDFPGETDLHEKINNVSRVIKDYRRRLLTRRASHTCWGRCYWGPSDNTDPDWNSNARENQKRVMVSDLALAFLLHMRYKMKEAMVIRYLVKNDKRYMIGYLFNRIRRLMYDLYKLFAAITRVEDDLDFRELHRTVRVHKQFVHLETDVRDTVRHIVHLYYNMMDPVTYEPTQKPGRPKKEDRPPKPKTAKTTFNPMG